MSDDPVESARSHTPLTVRRNGRPRTRPGRTFGQLPGNPTPMTPPRVRRIRGAKDVADELVTLYRAMRKGELETTAGTRMAYVLHLAGRVLAELNTAQEVARLRAELERLGAQPGVDALPDLSGLPDPAPEDPLAAPLSEGQPGPIAAPDQPSVTVDEVQSP
jgi:hypothetical protein